MEGQHNRQLPLVSIIIPTYNQREHFLKESIESAISQTYPNTEIILSDNHSTNGTSAIIAAYAQKDKRIRIIRPSQFLSLIENFIFAYSQAQGQYICPLSSDDILYPELIEEHLQPFFTYPELSFSYSIPLYFVTGINAAKWHSDKLATGFYPADLFLEIYIKRRHCSWGGILFKTADYNKIGGFLKEFAYAADVDLIIKLILLNGGVYCINKRLSAIRQWTRDEHTNRTPYAYAAFAKILDNIENEAIENKINLRMGIAKKAKKNVFAGEVFPIAYFIHFKKRSPDILEKTVAVVNENYPTGIYNFVIKNRKNFIGLAFSFGYLSFKKIRKLFKY